MKGIFPIDKFRTLQTPFYYYDTKVLRDTLSAINHEVSKYPNYSVHYAVKANANPKVLAIIRESGMGADCVSGGEIRAAIRAGFPANKVVFAGVGKADWEINLGLEYGIFCFNVESIPELEVINELAAAQNKIANVAFRINPDVGAHTHANITTGLAENKFGISMQDMDKVIDVALEMKNIKFIGLHFHIGSQILDMLIHKLGQFPIAQCFGSASDSGRTYKCRWWSGDRLRPSQPSGYPELQRLFCHLCRTTETASLSNTSF